MPSVSAIPLKPLKAFDSSNSYKSCNEGDDRTYGGEGLEVIEGRGIPSNPPNIPSFPALFYFLQVLDNSKTNQGRGRTYIE